MAFCSMCGAQRRRGRDYSRGDACDSCPSEYIAFLPALLLKPMITSRTATTKHGKMFIKRWKNVGVSFVNTLT